jgi:hypothetical protein
MSTAAAINHSNPISPFLRDRTQPSIVALYVHSCGSSSDVPPCRRNTLTEAPLQFFKNYAGGLTGAKYRAYSLSSGTLYGLK